MTLEFLYAAAYSNLYTNINMGAATEPFGWVTRGQVRRAQESAVCELCTA